MIEPNEMQFLCQRFDKIDLDNAEIKQDLKIVHTKVTRHGIYWDIVKWGAVSGVGIAASIAGFFGFKHN